MPGHELQPTESVFTTPLDGVAGVPGELGCCTGAQPRAAQDAKTGRTGVDYLILGLFLVGWIVLQHIVLPKLGVPT